MSQHDKIKSFRNFMAGMRRKLIVGNWKMNGGLAANQTLLDNTKAGLNGIACDMAVCVPTPYLAQCQSLLSDTSIAWGAQDLSLHESGAYTGEVSAAMLSDFGCRYVIVGHSERRMYHGEDDVMVTRKVERALKAGMTPILCVGESLAERESGSTAQVVGRQLDAVLDIVSVQDLERVVVAYEPIWAIGTGKTATPAMAQEVHALLRGKLEKKDPAAASNIRILYGGSMKPENAKELLAMSDIDGGLIGGASLKAEDFLAIARAA